MPLQKRIHAGEAIVLCHGGMLTGSARLAITANAAAMCAGGQEKDARHEWREWLPHAAFYADKPRKLAQWRDELLEAIASVTNLHRPERREPRAKKRRPKTHQLPTLPRHEFKQIPQREKYRKAA